MHQKGEYFSLPSLSFLVGCAINSSHGQASVFRWLNLSSFSAQCAVVSRRCSGYAYSFLLIYFSFADFQLSFEHEITSDRVIDRLMPYFSLMAGIFSPSGDWTCDHRWSSRSRHWVERTEKPALVNRAISDNLYFSREIQAQLVVHNLIHQRQDTIQFFKSRDICQPTACIFMLCRFDHLRWCC